MTISQPGTVGSAKQTPHNQVSSSSRKPRERNRGNISLNNATFPGASHESKRPEWPNMREISHLRIDTSANNDKPIETSSSDDSDEDAAEILIARTAMCAALCFMGYVIALATGYLKPA